MVYNAANSQQSNTDQYPTDKKVLKLFEVPTYNLIYFLAQNGYLFTVQHFTVVNPLTPKDFERHAVSL